MIIKTIAICLSITTLAILYLCLLIYKRKMQIWLPSYFFFSIKNIFIQKKYPVHIMFCFVDHFEPPLGEEKIGMRRIMEWVEKWPRIALKHKDSDGCIPRHTWFFAIENLDMPEIEEEFRYIVDLCKKGYGEVEVHIHHSYDNSESFRGKMLRGLEIYKRYGMLKKDIKTGGYRFAFIHGGWALDNSRKEDRYCGVNNELQVLRELGCYADFTFPSYGFTSQPKKINSIYYAKDDPQMPKSYNTGVDVRVGGSEWGDLLIIEGPLGIIWWAPPHRHYPFIETGDITDKNPPTEKRVAKWIELAPIVRGRPEWKFVKIYCHGCYDASMKILLGEPIDWMFSYLEDRYNDGTRYILHYVTSREMYNIIKAAESGLSKSPNNYRDYKIKEM